METPNTVVLRFSTAEYAMSSDLLLLKVIAIFEASADTLSEDTNRADYSGALVTKRMD